MSETNQGRHTIPYSYHTFLYPFLWNRKNYKNRAEFERSIGAEPEDGGCKSCLIWEPDDIIDKDCHLCHHTMDENAAEDAKWEYQAFQYYNSAARKALYRMDGDIVHNFKRRGVCPESARYIIKKNNISYVLRINGIRLKLYDTGVGLLIFELEYHLEDAADPVKKTREAAREDVRTINEYGRRLYPEFISDHNSEAYNLCADEISIQLSSCTEIMTAHFFKPGTDRESWKKTCERFLQNPSALPEIIRGILWGDKISRESEEKDLIIPAIDDRMFVCCCILDSDYADSFLGYQAWPGGEDSDKIKALNGQRHSWKFMTDWDKGTELYALANIDSTSASCQNRLMLDQYFEEQLYLRWLESGTIHAVTNHSMLCLTSKEVLLEVVFPFLFLYVQMCALVIVQRASLISMDSQITDAVAKNERVDSGELIRLEKDFAKFQGELLLGEVTSQIQGIEIYEKLQKMLFIDKLESNIQKQLSNLYQIARTELESEEAKLRAQIEEKEKEAEKKEARKQRVMETFLASLALFSIASAFVDLEDALIMWGVSENIAGCYATKIVLAISVAMLLILAFVWLFPKCRSFKNYLKKKFRKSK
ncbi:MAG: hypothetical protein IJ496_07990 [Ruminococcus sp.]|nr:hypothetical protein [Ruminococcus sp.]